MILCERKDNTAGLGFVPSLFWERLTAMNIPMEMLIEYMQYLNPEILLEKRDQWISGIKLMPEDGHIDPFFLYFCKIDAKPSVPVQAPVVYTCSKAQTYIKKPRNCIILHTEVTVTQVFNEMLGLQNLLRTWGQDIELSISRHQGVQQLLDISSRVFGNPIAVITPSFKTIAATWEHETEDAVFWELLELGYLTQDSFSRLRNQGYFNSDYYTGETVLIAPGDGRSYDTTLTAITKDDTVGFLVLMLCSNTAATRGALQLYKYFIEQLKVYLQPAAVTGDYLRKQFDYFIIDIIEGRVTTPRELVERSLVYPPAYTSDYNTVLISHEGSSSMYLDHAMQNLSAIFPNVRQILYNDCIILQPDLSASETRRLNFLATLSNYLDASRGYAGISEKASGLESVRESYRQARQALELGRRLMHASISDEMLTDKDKKSRIFRFEDYHVYSALSGAERDSGLLEQIRRYDLEHRTNYYHILYVFLSLERNYTKVATVLHMHRNNVIYHAKRINEIFGIDLDNNNQRLRLLVLYKLDDLLTAR